jgi:hypothetical protein
MRVVAFAPSLSAVEEDAGGVNIKGFPTPDGERVGSLEFSWDWADNPPTPVKFRVFTQYLPMRVEEAGVYSIGLYDSLEDTESDVLFPLPVLKSNPLLQNRI